MKKTKVKKINPQQLRKMIIEEIETLAYEEQELTVDQAESAELAREKAEDIETVEDAWAGGPNLVHAVHWGDESVDDDVTRGQEIMTIGVAESSTSKNTGDTLVNEEYKNEPYFATVRSPEVQEMLLNAGFNLSGESDDPGVMGPGEWGMFTPQSTEEAERWIQAALDLNAALDKAVEMIEKGQITPKYSDQSDLQGAYYQIIEPVQFRYSKLGASDTEGREAAAFGLETRTGKEWALDPYR